MTDSQSNKKSFLKKYTRTLINFSRASHNSLILKPNHSLQVPSLHYPFLILLYPHLSAAVPTA